MDERDKKTIETILFCILFGSLMLLTGYLIGHHAKEKEKYDLQNRILIEAERVINTCKNRYYQNYTINDKVIEFEDVRE